MFSRDSPNLLYSRFHRRAVKPPGSTGLEKRREKKQFVFPRRHFPLAFVHSANNPYDRLSRLFYCSTSYFVHQATCKRAGNHRRSLLLLLEPARFGSHIFLFLQEASESIFLILCISIGRLEFFSPLIAFRPLMACCCCFLLSLPFYHCFFFAPRLIENYEWELDGRP